MWGALGWSFSDLSKLPNTKVSQLRLPFEQKVEERVFSKVAVSEAMKKGRTLTNAAKILNCSISTIAVNARKYDIAFKHKPKKITEQLRSKVIYLSKLGLTSRKIAEQTNISVTSVNRIKRSS